MVAKIAIYSFRVVKDCVHKVGGVFKYGGWYLPRGIIYKLWAAVKVYVNEIDGTSPTVARTYRTVGSTSTVAGTCHTG